MALQTNTALLVGLFFLLHTWGGVKAQLKVEVEGRVDVSLGDDAEIPCLYTTDDGIGGLTIEWLYLGSGRRRHRIYLQDPTVRSEEPDTPFSGRIRVDVNGSRVPGQSVLTVLKARPGDEVEFICRVKSLTDGTDEGVTQLRVFETPDVPTIEAEASIWYINTEPVKVATCEAKNGYPRPNITWYKDNMPLINVPKQVYVAPLVTVDSRGLFSVTSELRINVVKEDKDSNLYCEVNYQTVGGYGMMESNTTQILVNYPTSKVDLWVESPKGAIKTGDTVELQCHGDGNPQPVFTFRSSGGEEDSVELESKDNILVLRDVSVLNSGLYECYTTDLDSFEEIVGNTTLMVNYLHPALVLPDEHVALQGEGITASCNALSSMDTDTVWTKDGKTLATGNILSLMDLTYDKAGAYECTVTVPTMPGMETRAMLQLAVHGPPEIRPPQTTSLEGMLDSTVVLTCSVSGVPTPTITWTSSDMEIYSVTSNVTAAGVVSVAHVQVTEDMNVTCNASNGIGDAELLFSIRAIMPTTDPPAPNISTVPTRIPQTDIAMPPKTIKRESSGVIIAVIIICLLLLAVLGSVLYFLYKKGKICGRSSKQDLTKEKTSRDNIVVEMKSDNTEEAVLLAVNGDKKQ